MSKDLRLAGCTIVAPNYLAYARVLASEWQRLHRHSPFHVLVIGDSTATDGLAVVSPEQLVAPPELGRMLGIYGVAEATAAFKPRLLRFLLDRDVDAVVYLDSDMDLHADLRDVGAAAVRNGVALSPHVLRRLPGDGRSPSELELGRVGIFNSGLIAVGRRGRSFLDWWASRVRRDCLFCEDLGLHADQRWLDWVPLYFRHEILRDPALNVAHWNLHERVIDRSADGYTVDGRPLRTFHFAGFDPESPGRLTWYEWADLRVPIDVEPDLRGLCREYAGKLLAAGHREARSVPYAYGTSAGGTALGPRERAVYRELVLAADAREDLDLPDPFDVERAAEFECLIADPRSAGLLSDGALERLGQLTPAAASRDLRKAPLHLAAEARRRLGSRLQERWNPWTPRPVAGDRTRTEYASSHG
jgi:hypothetical protein